MPDKEFMPYLKLLHGGFNFMVFLLFLFQAVLGLKIRSGRKKQEPDYRAVKVHRKTGPVFVFLGVSGFLAGKVLVYLDHGQFMKYPLHYFTGSAITLCIILAFLISRRIRGPEVRFREQHFRFGLAVICLYIVQIFLGLGILL